MKHQNSCCTGGLKAIQNNSLCSATINKWNKLSLYVLNMAWACACTFIRPDQHACMFLFIPPPSACLCVALPMGCASAPRVSLPPHWYCFLPKGLVSFPLDVLPPHRSRFIPTGLASSPGMIQGRDLWRKLDTVRFCPSRSGDRQRVRRLWPRNANMHMLALLTCTPRRVYALALRMACPPRRAYALALGMACPPRRAYALALLKTCTPRHMRTSTELLINDMHSR